MLVGTGSVYASPDFSGSIWPFSSPDPDIVGVGVTPIPNPICPDSNPACSRAERNCEVEPGELFSPSCLATVADFRFREPAKILVICEDLNLLSGPF